MIALIRRLIAHFARPGLIDPVAASIAPYADAPVHSRRRRDRAEAYAEALQADAISGERSG